MNTTCKHPECDLTITARGLCRKHYLQAWRAGQLEQHSTKQLPRCPESHPHDLTCWEQHGCKCGSCLRARKNKVQRHHTRMKAYGRNHYISPPRVDATPARTRVLELMAEGCALNSIGQAAGIGIGSMGHLIYGPRGKKTGTGLPTTIRHDHAEALLELTPSNIKNGVVDSRGTTRRLQALVAIGYTQSMLAKRLNMLVGNLNRIVIGIRDKVLASTAKKVAALYDELALTPWVGRGSASARKTARKHRWHPPLAWDNIDTDNHPATADTDVFIDEIAVELACTGQRVKLRTAERQEAVRRLHDLRYSDAAIAQRLHTYDKAITRIRQELVLTGWPVTKQQRNAA